MASAKTKCVFGPVPSRRLGVSLGVDLLPFKTCSLDCVYCECGRTTDLTTRRAEYCPTESVLDELDAFFATGEKIDCMTFSGVGEPTLHNGIGRIIEHVKAKHPEIRICLLTNGVFLGDPEVQSELKRLDLVVPSLDASDEEEFQTINRPAPGVSFQHLVESLVSFRRAVPITMWLEIFIVPGVNDSPESLIRFRDLVERIAPDKAQLNSLDRPGTEDWVEVPSKQELAHVRDVLAESGIPIEIISRSQKEESGVPPHENVEEYNDQILKTLRSRPCTPADLARALRFRPGQIAAHLRRLEREGLVVSESGPRGTYYRPAKS